jgi:hypothetical protein
MELRKLLEEETRLLVRFAAEQEELQALMSRHDWKAVDKRLEAMRGLSVRIEAVEQKREACYRVLRAEAGAREDETFDQVVSRLSVRESRELKAAYKKLKLAVLRAKGQAGRLGYFVQSLSDSLRRVLEEAFPHRRARIYARDGRSRAVSEQAFMINQRL